MSTLLLMLQAQEPESAPPADSFMDMLGGIAPAPFVRTLVILVVGIPLTYLASAWLRRWITGVMSPQAGLVAGRFAFYAATAIVLITTLNELGFSLAPLLGAAGVLGIAIGFASQTSVSNLISGIFLIAERPFVVGDLIEVDGVTGFVLSIDSISVKLRTFDNKMVRIPNETMVKSRVTNITRFPIRRVDIVVGVSYNEDPSRVRPILRDIADSNPLVLMEPEPVVIFQGFGDSSINFLLGVWATRETFLAVKNSIQEDIKARLDAEGIEIPFPHRTLYVGRATGAFPVEVVGRRDGIAEGEEANEA
ncbi:MAG TPA: mechanosensitive ion channel family protein [Longimicrobiales bacterium]|nr:mechanosensitive ion channel family protein [Longimicrobiales bacterium]